MSNQTFKRGQVVLALWQVLGEGRGEPSSVFASRVKRLLDIDRTSSGVRKSGLESEKHAFCDFATKGKGHEVEFSVFDAFCIGVALDMLSAGFNAQEIVFFFRHIKKGLQRIFDACKKKLPAHRQHLDPEDRPGCPTVTRKGVEYADCRVFMLLQRIEIPDDFRDARGKRTGGPTFLEPTFLHGIKTLSVELDELGDRYSYVYVQELAHLICRLMPRLAEAPEIKRGRK